MQTIVRLYGVCYGVKRLAWIGTDDRLDLYFFPVGGNKYMRRGPSEPGWSDRYQLEVCVDL